MEANKTMETETRRVSDLIKQFENNQVVCRTLKTSGEDRNEFCGSRERYLAARRELLKHWNYCENTTWSYRRPGRRLKKNTAECANDKDGRIRRDQDMQNSGSSSAEYYSAPLQYDFSDSDEFFFSATSLSQTSSSGEMISADNGGTESVTQLMMIPPLNLYEPCLSEFESDKDGSDSDEEYGLDFISAHSSTSTMWDNGEKYTAEKSANPTDDEEFYTYNLCTLFDTQLHPDEFSCQNSARSIETITPCASGLVDPLDNESPITDLSGKRVEALFTEIYNSNKIDDDMDNKFAQLFEDTFQSKQDEYDMAVQLYESIVS